MAKFVKGTTVSTGTPTVVVDAGLPIGRHHFQLVVVDESGNRSAPAVVEVVIRDGPGTVGRGLMGRLGEFFGRRSPPE